jgi:hypothetical protein
MRLRSTFSRCKDMTLYRGNRVQRVVILLSILFAVVVDGYVDTYTTEYDTLLL